MKLTRHDTRCAKLVLTVKIKHYETVEPSIGVITMSRIHWLAIPAVLASLVLTVPLSDLAAQEAPAAKPPQPEAALGTSVEVRGMSGPTLNVRRDRAEILHLERNAASVIIGNPALVSVTVETPRRLVIVPVDEGMTTLTILDNSGAIITERPVVVSSNLDRNFVRVRRICPDAAGCEDRDVYYCEDGQGCHTVSSEPTEVAAQSSAAVTSTGGGAPASSGDTGSDPLGSLFGDLFGQAMSGAMSGTTEAIQDMESSFENETPQ